MSTPSDEAVTGALQRIKEAEPALGLPKVHARLKADNHWQLSLDRVRKLASAQGLVNTNQLYTIKQTADRGLGAFATKAIQPGTVVIAETPLVVTRGDSVNLAYSTLSDAHKSLYMSFTQSTSTARTSSVAERIFSNNAYLWDPAHSDLAAIFPTLPRFNHSCSPYLTYQTLHTQQKGAFVAIVPVTAGEELCTSYCERVNIRSERRAQLKATYGFECQCPTCALPAEAQRSSDVKRLACRRLDEAVTKPHPPVDRLRFVHLRLRLLREERLPGPDCARSLWDAVQICQHVKDQHSKISMYAAIAASEYEVGGNQAEADDIRKSLVQEKSRDVAELWSELDSLPALGWASTSEREEWEKQQVDEAAAALNRLV